MEAVDAKSHDENGRAPRYRLEFVHFCLSLGCREDGCVLCKRCQRKRCLTAAGFSDKYLANGDPIAARCGGDIQVRLVDNTTGQTSEGSKCAHFSVELCILDGGQYEKLPAHQRLDDAAVRECQLLSNNKGQPLLVPGRTRDTQQDEHKRVLLACDFSHGPVSLPELRVTDSSEAMLGGKQPNFYLYARALPSCKHAPGAGCVSGWQVASAVSDGFVVATQRTKPFTKAEIPHMRDPVSKVNCVGAQTQQKLRDLRAAAAAAKVPDLNVPVNSVTTVGQLKELVEMAERNRPLREHLKIVLRLTKQWDAMRDHVLSAVDDDTALRVWYRGMQGLVFRCGEQNAVDLQQPIGVVVRRCRPDDHLMDIHWSARRARARDVRRDQMGLTPAEIDGMMDDLLVHAVREWWQPGHPSWALLPQGVEPPAVEEEGGLLTLEVPRLGEQPGVAPLPRDPPFQFTPSTVIRPGSSAARAAFEQMQMKAELQKQYGVAPAALAVQRVVTSGQLPGVAGLSGQVPWVAGLSGQLPGVAGLPGQVPWVGGLSGQVPRADLPYGHPAAPLQNFKASSALPELSPAAAAHFAAQQAALMEHKQQLPPAGEPAWSAEAGDGAADVLDTWGPLLGQGGGGDGGDGGSGSRTQRAAAAAPPPGWYASEGLAPEWQPPAAAMQFGGGWPAGDEHWGDVSQRLHATAAASVGVDGGVGGGFDGLERQGWQEAGAAAEDGCGASPFDDIANQLIMKQRMALHAAQKYREEQQAALAQMAAEQHGTGAAATAPGPDAAPGGADAPRDDSLARSRVERAQPRTGEPAAPPPPEVSMDWLGFLDASMGTGGGGAAPTAQRGWEASMGGGAQYPHYRAPSAEHQRARAESLAEMQEQMRNSISKWAEVARSSGLEPVAGCGPPDARVGVSEEALEELRRLLLLNGMPSWPMGGGGSGLPQDMSGLDDLAMLDDALPKP